MAQHESNDSLGLKQENFNIRDFHFYIWQIIRLGIQNTKSVTNLLCFVFRRNIAKQNKKQNKTKQNKKKNHGEIFV